MAAMTFEEALGVIARYEESIGRPTPERWTMPPSELNAWQTAPLAERNPAAYLEYASKCREYLRFGHEVDQALAGKIGRKDRLMMRTHTPNLLQAVGFLDLPMLYTVSHFKEAIHNKDARQRHWHGLAVQQVKAIPEQLEKPVAVIEALNGTGNMVLILDKSDNDGLPIIVPFEPDGEGHYQGQEILTNMILSVYGREGISNYLEMAIDQKKVLFWDREGIKRLSLGAGLELPRSYESLNAIIRQYHPEIQGKSVNPGSSADAKAEKQEADRLLQLSGRQSPRTYKSLNETIRQNNPEIQGKSPNPGSSADARVEQLKETFFSEMSAKYNGAPPGKEPRQETGKQDAPDKKPHKKTKHNR